MISIDEICVSLCKINNDIEILQDRANVLNKTVKHLLNNGDKSIFKECQTIDEVYKVAKKINFRRFEIE